MSLYAHSQTDVYPYLEAVVLGSEVGFTIDLYICVDVNSHRHACLMIRNAYIQTRACVSFQTNDTLMRTHDYMNIRTYEWKTRLNDWMSEDGSSAYL